jgi:hypothetical protein
MAQDRRADSSRAESRTAESLPHASRRPEPRLPIRLIALDIDGTLVGPDLVVADRTRSEEHTSELQSLR